MADIINRLRIAHQNVIQTFPGATIFGDAADEIERLRKALEPFAREADQYDPDTGDDRDVPWVHPGFKILHLRAARAALDQDKGSVE